VDADTLRYVTIVLTLLACLLTPRAVYRRVPSNAAALIVMVLVIQYVGATVAVVDSIGQPIVWYRTPRILLASILSLLYVWAARPRR